MSTRKVVATLLRNRSNGTLVIATQGAPGNRVLDVRAATDGVLHATHGLCLSAEMWRSALRHITRAVEELENEAA